MKSFESTGKTVDEAIIKGLNELELSIDSVDVEILQHETKGVFGIGAKPAKVRLRVKERTHTGHDILNELSGRSESREKAERNVTSERNAPTERNAQTKREETTKREAPAKREACAPVQKKSAPAAETKPVSPKVAEVKPAQKAAEVKTEEVKSARPETDGTIKRAMREKDSYRKQLRGEKKGELEKPVKKTTQTAQTTQTTQKERTFAPRRENNDKAAAMPAISQSELAELTKEKGKGSFPRLILAAEPNAEAAQKPKSYSMPKLVVAAEDDPSFVKPEQPARTYGERRENSERRGYDRRGRSDRGARTERTERSERTHEREQKVEPALPYTEEYAKNNEAACFLQGMLEKMGIAGTIVGCEHDDGVRLRIDTEEKGILIGHRGETLDALQYIASLVVNKSVTEENFKRITVDSEGYRFKREDTLSHLAFSRAAKVKSSGRPYKFEPMNPYERRVIHSALQSHAYVETHSEGVGADRHVVITPKRPS